MIKCPKCKHEFKVKKKKPVRKRCFYCRELIEKHKGIKLYNCGTSPSTIEHWHKACRDKIKYCWKCKEWKDNVTIEHGASYGICKECINKDPEESNDEG